MYSCGVKMIWIFLILSQLHVIYSFPADVIKNAEIVASSFPDLELIEPPVNLSSNLEKGNEKTHKIADSYRPSNDTGKSNVTFDQSRQSVITIDHVSPGQRPPYGRPPMPPTVVEVFKPPTKPANGPVPFPPIRPSSFLPGRPFPPVRPLYPSSRPDLFPPAGPYPANIPPDVEVFNLPGSMSPNVPLPPDVEVFNPSEVRPISNVAVIMPYNKNSINSKGAVNDSSAKVNLFTFDIPEEPQESNSYPGYNATKVYADYERLLRFLDSEESPADPKLSNKSSESENISGTTTEPPAKSYMASKENHDFVVRIYHNPPKMCYRILRADNYEEPEKCITFSENTSMANITEREENVNHSTKIEDQSTNSSIMEIDESEVLETEAVERNPSTEINAPFENVTQSIPVKRPIEDLLESDNAEVKKLIDELLVAADEIDDTTEFSVTQETNTEELKTQESSDVKVITLESLENFENDTDSQTQQNLDTKISKDPVSSHDKQISSGKYKELCRLLAEYLVDRMNISPGISEKVRNHEGLAEYVSPALPLPYVQPLASGRSADNREDLGSILDFVDLVLPEGSPFDRSVLPGGVIRGANSEVYFQQPEIFRPAEPYLSPPEEIILPIGFDGYV